MGTRCMIGYERNDGKVESVYCHYDGYPEYTGRVLIEHYTDITKIHELISKGSMSFLEDTVDKCKFYGPDADGELEIYYYSDRADFFRDYNGVQYLYLFRNNKWVCLNAYSEEEVFLYDDL